MLGKSTNVARNIVAPFGHHVGVAACCTSYFERYKSNDGTSTSIADISLSLERFQRLLSRFQSISLKIQLLTGTACVQGAGFPPQGGTVVVGWGLLEGNPSLTLVSALRPFPATTMFCHHNCNVFIHILLTH